MGRLPYLPTNTIEVRSKPPLISLPIPNFFGTWGTLFFLAGFGISVYLVISKFIDKNFALTNRPGFYLALAATIIGTQLFVTGFVAELISRNAPGRNAYLIEERLGL